MRKFILSLLSLGFVPAVASARPHFFFDFFIPAPVPVVVAPAPVCVEPAPEVTFVAPPLPVVEIVVPSPPVVVYRPFWSDRHFHR